ncbi:MAG: MopE-related protein, partial [Myxococcota bacterium]
MSRSLLSLLALACVFTVGCPGGTGSTEDKDVGGTETGESGVDCFDEDGDGYCTSDGDCDDNDPSVSPDADEICDGNDNNCNGEIDENGETVFYADSDGDGFGDPDMSVTACEPDSGFVANSDDCDDRESMVYPGADEQCDGLDNDCDRVVDEDLTTTFYRDADGDGYGDEGWAVEECTSPGEGWVGSGGDCDDSEPFAWTGATELCDSVDNDCNGTVDDGLSTRWYPDADGDGYGDESAAMDSCVDPGAGYLSTGGDCDDGEPRAWTGASEYCDTVDNDCNGLVDDDALDATDQIADDDGDGFGSPTEVVWACSPIVDNTLDCDDGNAREPQVVDDSASASSADGSMTNPWTTIQDGIDNARMCVAVMEGAYYENVNFNGADVDVFSTAGREATVLDAGGTGTVVTFENGETAGAALRGFTVQNGGGALDSYSVSDPECASTSICVSTYNTYLGGGILVDGASPTLSDLWVTGNILPVATVVEHSETEIEYTRSYGGGIFVRNAVGGMAVTDVTVDWNYADQGGGVFVGEGSGIDFSQTRFNYNEAT